MSASLLEDLLIMRWPLSGPQGPLLLCGSRVAPVGSGGRAMCPATLAMVMAVTNGNVSRAATTGSISHLADILQSLA